MITTPSSSSSAGIWPAGFFDRYGSLRFSPAIRSTCTLGISMPFSAMNIFTTRGFGPIEL